MNTVIASTPVELRGRGNEKEVQGRTGERFGDGSDFARPFACVCLRVGLGQ